MRVGLFSRVKGRDGGVQSPESSAQWTAFRAALLQEVNLEQDSLRFYFLGNEWKRRVEHVGSKPSYDPQGPLIF